MSSKSQIKKARETVAGGVKFTFRDGYRGSVSPDIAAAELERVRLNNGGILKAADVVNASVSTNSPLHGEFEWDDSVAGHNYRTYQARNLIRAVQVVHENDNLPGSVYVHVPNTANPGYMQTEVVVKRPDLFAIALGQMQTKINELSQSVSELKRIAESENDSENSELLARIALAFGAVNTARAAIAAIH